MTRSVDEWTTLMGGLPAPSSAELAIAERIMADMIGYSPRTSPSKRGEDAAQLSNALMAYARLTHDHGWKP